MQTGTVPYMEPRLINRLPADLESLEMPEKSFARERRKRARAQVHWPLSFSRPGTSEIVHSMTHDLSSDGFYCIANAIFVPGETRDCTLAVPTRHPQGGVRAVPVLCKVRVIRVEVKDDDGSYGVGCQITDYRFGSSS